MSEPEYLTTREVARLLRLKERRVYELARRGELPAVRITGRLLFPRTAVLARITPQAQATTPSPPPDVLAGSHDPLLEWALRESGSGLASWFDGSEAGLELFLARRAAVAALHLFDPASGRFNVPLVATRAAHLPAVLVAWAQRSRGLLLAPAVAARVQQLADIRGLRVVMRQPGSGAARLFAHLLEESGLGPDTFEAVAPPARTEHELAMMLVEGRADVGFGLEALARPLGLGFVPLLRESFDLLVDRRAWFEPPLQRLWTFARTPRFRARARELGGYDIAELGTVRWNA